MKKLYTDILNLIHIRPASSQHFNSKTSFQQAGNETVIRLNGWATDQCQTVGFGFGHKKPAGHMSSVSGRSGSHHTASRHLAHRLIIIHFEGRPFVIFSGALTNPRADEKVTTLREPCMTNVFMLLLKYRLLWQHFSFRSLSSVAAAYAIRLQSITFGEYAYNQEVCKKC